MAASRAAAASTKRVKVVRNLAPSKRSRSTAYNPTPCALFSDRLKETHTIAPRIVYSLDSDQVKSMRSCFLQFEAGEHDGFTVTP